MLMRRYEMPWRRAYEIYAGAAWLMAMAFFAAVGATHQLPRPLALPLALLCFAMGLLRIAQGVHTLVLRASLSGRAIQVIGTGELARWCHQPDEVFLGFGFEWRPVHSQRLYELAKVDYREFAVSLACWRCWATTRGRSPTQRSACPTSTVSSRASCRCTGHYRISRVAPCWSAQRSRAKALHWPA